MAVSVFDLFSIGIGPSSSHTVGPMRAALRFVEDMALKGLLSQGDRVLIDLYGSLALTGRGHGTDRAVLLGLEGATPESIDPGEIEGRLSRIRERERLCLAGRQDLNFDEQRDLRFHLGQFLPYHSNGMRFTLFKGGVELATNVFYSVGGGFIVDESHARRDEIETETPEAKLPFPFSSGRELLQHCEREKMSIAELVLRNESVWRKPEEVAEGLIEIWKVMRASIDAGCRAEGILPGGLNVKRRAAALAGHLGKPHLEGLRDPTEVMDWVSLWALAVNEENAAGGRVVTAPTNGAAGVIPAVLRYYEAFVRDASPQGIVEFLLTAGAIGMLYQVGASISAAEVGCQGEVGVACSMAAGALAAVLGANPRQVENAAEIGMEHNLGLTCDPVKGLVQIPCIERNTMGAIKAINAARLAIKGDGASHKVSLDQVIKTMWETGKDMQSHYKETSLGGLSVNVIEC